MNLPLKLIALFVVFSLMVFGATVSEDQKRGESLDSSEVCAEAIRQKAAQSQFKPSYRNYVLGVLFLGYVVNVMDRGVLNVLLDEIKREFTVSDTQLGLLGGIAFALFYATLGIPIAAWADRTSRRNVLALAVALWSVMTALCGMALGYWTLLLARIGTAVGEAGGTPPSHSLISDYFERSKRATALSIYALGVPVGTMAGSFFGGWGNELYGWRFTFVLVGLPGLLVALLVRFTVREPARGSSDNVRAVAGPASAPAASPVPSLRHAFTYLWNRPSFRHLSLAAALHSVVWYGGSTFNAVFFIRSHQMTTGEAGSWLAGIAAAGAMGTFLGGFLADRFSVRMNDARWYMWMPGYATLIMVPFQFFAYLPADLALALPAFAMMTFLASFFFGPSFAMAQALAPVRMRSVSTSMMLFMQTLIGLGLGPLAVGMVSDVLAPSAGNDSLRYGLVIVGLANVWAAIHYFLASRSVREDLASIER